jgi:hypothetical protein
MGFSHCKTNNVAGPFRLRLTGVESIRATITSLLDQAVQRRSSARNGSQIARVMTYLVEASLVMLKAHKDTEYHLHFRTPFVEVGEIRIGNTIIHITSAPEPKLI